MPGRRTAPPGAGSLAEGRLVGAPRTGCSRWAAARSLVVLRGTAARPGQSPHSPFAVAPDVVVAAAVDTSPVVVSAPAPAAAAAGRIASAVLSAVAAAVAAGGEAAAASAVAVAAVVAS